MSAAPALARSFRAAPFSAYDSASTTFFGSVLYAGSEMMKLLKNSALQITPAQPNAVNSAIHLKWTKDNPAAATKKE